MNSKKTPAYTLHDLARRTARAADEKGYLDLGAAPFEPASPEETHAAFLDENTVPRMLATAMLVEALSEREQAAIGVRNGLAVVVEVAHPEMVAPVADALRTAGTFSEILQRSGSNRSQDRADFGCDKVANLLGAGANVAGVSPSPTRYLPSTLTAAADMHLTLGAPTPRAVRSIIGLVTGRQPRKLPPLAGLTFLDVCAAIRRNSSAATCAKRLAAMAAAKLAVVATNDAPPLEQMHGLGEAKEWGLALAAAVEEWRSGRPWESLPDKSVVIGGPPGTGKTSFCVSLAKSLKLPLHITSASAWFSANGGYLGDVIAAINSAFTNASANGPAVLFIDELDAVPNRDTLDSRHQSFWTPAVTALLLALDSAASSSANLVVVGATNYPDRLDSALVRPGRLNRVLNIRMPDADAIVGILRQHLGNALPEADLTPFGILGGGASGADIAGWARAAKAAARSAGRAVAMDDVVRQVCPPETRPPETVRAIARHEASHAVLGVVTATGELEVVTVVERGSFAGCTNVRLQNPAMMTSAQVDALAVTQLAGRAADEIWGEPTCGAGGERWSDLAVATELLATKAASWGLSGSILYRGDRAEAQALIRADGKFREGVERDLNRLYARALRLVRENRDRIERVTDLLVERRVLGGAEVSAIIADTPPTPVHGVEDTAGGLHA
ncbi:AAA family ATPase [Methylorubrum sp. Q1]|uniref:AAA family ATPase n=1 Tax=Methylorubrum sp. Q1 TaxID=2562453 RepID=UPI00187D1D42|nr:AAA family ATPase [Methylorubrum sp. Q1]